MRRVEGVAPAAAWRSAPASLVLDGAQGCVVVVLFGLGWLLVALGVAALALFVIKTQSGDAKGDKQPAKTEQHNNNAPLRTIKHK